MRGRTFTFLIGVGAVAATSASADENPILFAQPFQIAQSNGQAQQQRVQPVPDVAPPEPQRWSVAIGGLYTQRDVEKSGWAPNLEVNYSLTDRFQLHLMVPNAFDSFNGGSTHFGIGDVETGVRFRFVDDDPTSWQPAVAFYPLVDFGTGSKRDNLGTGSTHAFLPLWFSKSFGPWIPYGGGGLWINPGAGNRNWGFVTAGVIRVIDDSWSLTGEVFYASSSKIGIKDQTGFDVGARYNINEHHHLVLTLGRGLQNADETNQFTGFLSYAVTF